MGSYIYFSTESDPDEVTKFLESNSINLKLCKDLDEGCITIRTQEDIDKIDKNDSYNYMKAKKDLGRGSLKTTANVDEKAQEKGFTYEDIAEMYTQVFEKLNSLFKMKYDAIGGAFNTDAFFFSLKQMKRITNNGELLIGKGSKIYIQLMDILSQKTTKSFTKQLATVQNANEDFEWYPTTKEIINAVYWDCLNKNTWYGVENCSNANKKYDYTIKSFLDIGAGNGKFFATMQEIEDAQEEKNFSFDNMFAIEKSQSLISMLDSDIFIVGTDFFESVLIDKKVDIIFSNPPYTCFSPWSVKIIKEANAQDIYLVIPSRWSRDEAIAEAIESRNATVTIVDSFSFEDAEDRKARATVDLVKIRLKSDKKDSYDAFETWFNETFKVNLDKDTNSNRDYDHEKNKVKTERIRNLVKGSNLVGRLEELYNEEMEHLMQNYSSIANLDSELLKEIGVSISGLIGSLKSKIEGTKNIYWQQLFDNMDSITIRLTESSRKSLLGTLTSRTSVDFTASNAHAIVTWAVKNANKYFDSQLLKLYSSLTKQHNVRLYKSNAYWTNDKWKFNRNNEKISHCSLEYSIVDYHFDAICSSYQAVDGMGPVSRTQIKDIIVIGKNLGFNISSNINDFYFHAGKKNVFMMVEAGKEEVFMEVKAFKNGNLHFKFNKKFMKAFNLEASRLNGWIKSPKEACEEFDITEKEAQCYFGSNFIIEAGSYDNLLPLIPQEEVILKEHTETSVNFVKIQNLQVGYEIVLNAEHEDKLKYPEKAAYEEGRLF